MSDSNQFGSAGTAVAEPPADEALAASKGPKPLVLVAVVVGVLALAAAAYFLLFSGGSSDDTASSGTVPHASTPASGSQAPSASAKPVTTTAAHTSTGGGRDPFAPLVVAAASGSASATATSSAGSSSGSGGTTASTVPNGLVETIVLNKVSSSAVTVDVTVNGTKYLGVKRGEVFAKYFSLNLIAGTTQAQFNFGDSNFVLDVGKGATIRT